MGATVIDALVVTLGLDGTKFKKGAKETDEALAKTSERATKTSKEMEAWGKNAAAGMSKLRNEVLGLLAVFTAGMGIKNFIEHTISSTASLGRLSQNLDMSAKDLAMWQLANKNAGGSVEGMTAQLKEAQQAIADYRLGRENASNVAFFGVGGKDADFKNVETLMRARADAVARIAQTHGVGVAQRKGAEFGISEDTFNLLKQGSAEVDRLRQAQERLAQAQADASDKAEAFRKKWDTLQNQFEAVGVEILTGLLPTMNRIADWLTANQDKVTEWGGKAAAAITSFSNAVVIASNIIGPILSTIAKGWENIYGWTKLAGEAISKMLPPKWLDKIGEGTAWLFDKLGVRNQVDDLMGLNGSPGAPATAAPAKPAAGGSTGGSTPADFNAKYGAAAAKAGAALGVDPRVILGQWGVETGWGKSVIPGTNNLGNIKDFSGGGVSAKDNMNGSVDKYRAYASADQFADDYVSLIKRKYPKAVGAKDAESFGQALKSGGYAEDPGYVSKLARAAQIAGLSGATGAANSAQVAQAARAGAGRGGNTSTSTNETNINGPINVYTQATDANGIAKDMKPALSRYSFAGQSNTGLT